MNQPKHPTDLDVGRGWLNRAAEMLDSCEDHVSDAEFARAAATIGAGFVALAHTERSLASAAALDAAAERVRRAAAEARPHDDEPQPGDRAYLASTPWDHAVDCQGDCEQPGKVPCCADEAIPDVIRHVHADEGPVLGDVIKCQQCGRQSRSISRGCSVCGLGTPEPRFLGFTEHGYPVVDQLPPSAVVPCGGAQACGACADDTGDLRRAAREADRG